MTDDNYKSPWQQAHEEREAKLKAEEQAQEKESEQRFFASLKLSKRLSNLRPKPRELTPEEQERRNQLEDEKARVKAEKADAKAVKQAASPVRPLIRKTWPMMTALAVILVLTGLYISPLNSIASFKVTGTQALTANQVASATQLSSAEKVSSLIFRLPFLGQKVAKALPRVDTASMSYQFPNRFTLAVKEYQPAAYLETGGSDYLVLTSGYVVKNKPLTAKQLEPSMPVLKDLSNADVATFVKQYSFLDSTVKPLIKTVEACPTPETKDFIALNMSNTDQVRVPLSKMAEKLEYYPSIVKQLKGRQVIDMEVGIFAKPYDSYIAEFGSYSPIKSDATTKPSSSASMPSNANQSSDSTVKSSDSASSTSDSTVKTSDSSSSQQIKTEKAGE